MNTTEKQMINNVMKGIAELTTKDLKNHSGETRYSECKIQEGYHDYLKINYKGQKINYFMYDFDWNSTPDIKLDAEPLESISKEKLINNVIPQLKQEINKFVFKESNQPMFRYYLNITLEFDYKDGKHTEKYRVENEELKLDLRERMNSYVTKVIFNLDQPIKDKREVSVFSSRILDFNLMERTPMEVIEVIEQLVNHTLTDIRNRSMRSSFEGSILHSLKSWVTDEFKPLYFDIAEKYSYKGDTLKASFDKEHVDPEKLDLFVYTAFLRIKQKDYASFALKDLQVASKDLGSETARNYLNVGSGLFEKEAIHYKDRELECKANDVFSSISIKIKNESVENYSKALDFIINLLQLGFPVSYFIKFSSKSEKEFLPIKGIAKSATHRFFNNCLQYSELHQKMEQYAHLAMVEFELYGDVAEGEKSCLPGSYAVFGLGLTSEKHFPLVQKYFEILDDEHQMAHKYFISNLVDQYAITKDSISLICQGIVSAQFEMVYKNLASLMNEEENLTLLINELKLLESHDVEDIAHSIWGKSYASKIKKLSPKFRDQLSELLKE